MGRASRADEAGGIYHMLNRANRRQKIFQKQQDYVAFEAILEESLERFELELYSFCVMPNHWHLVVSPRVDGEMGRFGQWLTLTHTQRHHAHYETVGEGHLYQGRYKSFPAQDDEHFLALCRYVERNAYTAGLCPEPDAWRWSSLWRWRHGSAKEKSLLSRWPLPRRRGWLEWVKTPLSTREVARIQQCIRRGSPYGEEAWTRATARRLGLESTLRRPGRPRKLPI